MSDLERACKLLKGGDNQAVVTIVGPVIRIEKAGNAVEIVREHIGGVDWLVLKLNGKRVHQG